MIFHNGQQFDTTKVTDYLNTLGCYAWFTTVAHPQTNGAKIANKIILEVVASITVAKVQKFIWKSIITHFSVPRAMIFDNGQQFNIAKVTDYLKTLGC